MKYSVMRRNTREAIEKLRKMNLEEASAVTIAQEVRNRLDLSLQQAHSVGLIIKGLTTKRSTKPKSYPRGTTNQPRQ